MSTFRADLLPPAEVAFRLIISKYDERLLDEKLPSPADVKAFSDELIATALVYSAGGINRAARLLQMDRVTLSMYAKRRGIDPKRPLAAAPTLQALVCK